MTTKTAEKPAAETPPATARPAPLITVGTGPRNARTDPATGLRFYSWNGAEYPSVTTVRRMAGLPHGLHQWILSQVIDAAMARGPAIVRVRDHVPPDPAAVQLLRAELRTASTAERDKAAALGTAVHDAAATGKSPVDVDPELRPRLRQYLDWLRASGAVVVASEFQVWNLTEGYAGTADALVRFRDGSIWVVDYKTGKGVYGEHALQLMAYFMAEFVGGRDDAGRDTVDEAATALLQRSVGMGVLHLADDHWEFRSVRADAETWDAFRGLLRFAVWMSTHEQADAVTLAKKAGNEATAGEPAA